MIVLASILAYLIGSISSAVIVGRVFFKQDIKKIGSGNAGATNALRAFGKMVGASVFLFDFLKGFIAVWLGYRIAGDLGSYGAAIGVILGHTFPVFFGFKGGKGIATAAGLLFFLDLKMILILLAIFFIVVISSKIVSLGSVIVAILAPIYTYRFYYQDNKIYFFSILILASIILFNHRSNIGRLIRGEENKLGRVKNEKN